MRSGYLGLTVNNTLRVISIYGYDWSRHAELWGAVIYPEADSTADKLYFNIDTDISTRPSYALQRFGGFSLRCLSTAVEGEE